MTQEDQPLRADGFARMIEDSDAFFTALRENNNKAWFDPRKAHFVEAIRKPAEFLADLLAEDFSRISGRPYAPKVFRIYRDVRFSKDKTPFKTHLHMMWQTGGKDPLAPFFFFGTEPGEQRIGCGLRGMSGPALRRYREFVDAEGKALEAAIAASGLALANWGEAPLKNVPKPFAPDHPQAALLKRKNLILSAPLEKSWRSAAGGLPGAITRAFEQARPVMALLEGALPPRA
jgi:uncharacterized protein (TIGR02453 family)